MISPMNLVGPFYEAYQAANLYSGKSVYSQPLVPDHLAQEEWSRRLLSAFSSI